MIAGSASGVGKTVTTLALIAGLQADGYTVQTAKAGPDFIDPSHHAALAGKPSRTLDVWMQGEDGVRENYARGTGDLCLVEGVMGLYDGDVSSTAHVAEVLDLPVILVIDGSARMESVAAEALGYRAYAEDAGRDIDVVGIIAQQVHGGRHEAGIREALPDDMQYFGRIPAKEELEIPDRYLGLHLGDEHPISTDELEAAAEQLAIEQVVSVARRPRVSDCVETAAPTRNRIAVARGAGFRFCYPAVIEQLRSTAQVIPFSPVNGDDVPACDGVYLPGGYPERYAAELATCPAIETIQERACNEIPILGECGGMMVLANSLETRDGETYSMAGVLPAAVRMEERLQALDHVELEAQIDVITAGRGERLRGHEFHYSAAEVDDDAAFAFTVRRGNGISEGRDGLVEYATLGTYCHVHAASGAFGRFLEEC